MSLYVGSPTDVRAESVHLWGEDRTTAWRLRGKDETVYISSLEIPVTLPENYIFPPTFHSCFISRVYALRAVLAYRPHGCVQKKARLSLTVPVQIVTLWSSL